MDSITIRRPDDWHLHLRDGEMLTRVAPLSHDFARAIVMPNLVPPILTGSQAAAYRARIKSAGFAHPLMTLYLTEETDPDDVVAAHAEGAIHAVKLYPAGATTNSASGVRDFDKVRPVLAAMEAHGVPLCLHGEVTEPEVDIFDREAAFLERRLDPIRRAHPKLKLTLEHVTTAEAADYVVENGLGATITPQHLLADRNDMLAGGMRPHFYCLPILKRRAHREALRRAAVTHDNFFLGTDSAPHPTQAKEGACCAAGCFTAPHALGLYATVFEEAGALDRLEAFASLNGPRHYGLPPNEDRITLVRDPEPVVLPERHGDAEPTVVPFDPGRPIHWRVA